MTRVDRDSYFMKLAHVVKTRGTCPRRQVGALLVAGRSVIGMGYNGAARGEPHCDEVGCYLVIDGERERCIRTVHAEVNVVLEAPLILFRDRVDLTLYTTDQPCYTCQLILMNAGVSRIVYDNAYDDARGEPISSILEQLTHPADGPIVAAPPVPEGSPCTACGHGYALHGILGCTGCVAQWSEHRYTRRRGNAVLEDD